MSEISKELREQQDKSIPEAFKKIFGDIPTIDAKEVAEIQKQQREQFERDAIALVDQLNVLNAERRQKP